MLGEKIRILREKYEWTQDELGKKIGLDKKQICRYEKNVVTPSIYRIRDIAKALGVTVDYLLSEDLAEKKEKEIIKDVELYSYYKILCDLEGKKKEVAKNLMKGVIKIAEI